MARGTQVASKARQATRAGRIAGAVGRAAAKACSFSAETVVATTDGAKPISTVQDGDQVLAYNEALGTTGSYTVTDVIAHIDPVIVHLTIDGELIETTPEHPFYAEDQGWTPAGELWVGVQVRRVDGTYRKVESVAVVAQAQPMYNLSVAEAHTFFVGDQAWLVHNSCALRKFAPGKWVDHFQKHMGEFGWKHANDYLLDAQRITGGVSGHYKHVRKGGDTLFFDPTTGKFAILGKDGQTIRTLFVPKGNPINYWIKETGGNWTVIP